MIENLTSPNETMLRKLPEMPEEYEDDLDIVSEDELEQESHKPYNPIVSVEYFFSNNMPLDSHSLEQNPCYHVIGSRPGEIPTDTVYYCKLHPEALGSAFLTAIENHCRDDPDIHKSEILRIMDQGESS